MPLKAIAFDWGHTVMDERRDAHLPLDLRPVYLMPGVRDVLPQLHVPLALWANSQRAGEVAIRQWLERAGLARYFEWVITSFDAGARKPAPEFFCYALARCGCSRGEVLFVGNQLNTDIAGGHAYGIQTVWLSGDAYRSDDDAPCDAAPTFTIQTLYDLPVLVQRITSSGRPTV